MNFRFAFLLFSTSFIVESNGDVVDDAMVGDIATYNVRGAGITFFDSVSAMGEPRAYEKNQMLTHVFRLKLTRLSPGDMGGLDVHRMRLP